MRISDWSSDVCSSDLHGPHRRPQALGKTDRHAVERRANVLHRASRGDRRVEHPGAVQVQAQAMLAREGRGLEIGRASCRERVGQYVSISVVAVSSKKKTYTSQNQTYKQKED